VLALLHQRQLVPQVVFDRHQLARGVFQLVARVVEIVDHVVQPVE